MTISYSVEKKGRSTQTVCQKCLVSDREHKNMLENKNAKQNKADPLCILN